MSIVHNNTHAHVNSS